MQLGEISKEELVDPMSYQFCVIFGSFCDAGASRVPSMDRRIFHIGIDVVCDDGICVVLEFMCGISACRSSSISL